MSLSLKGKLLLAMPGLTDTTFRESVVFMCAHSADGAMGLIINKPLPGANFMELAEKLDFSKTKPAHRKKLLETQLLLGGPVDQHRGFVLHDASYHSADSTLEVMPGFKLTATIDVLQDIALGHGPRRFALALGYSGWTAGQLENEIVYNGWLHCDADEDLVFAHDWPLKHRRAMIKLGIDPGMLSGSAGHG